MAQTFSRPQHWHVMASVLLGFINVLLDRISGREFGRKERLHDGSIAVNSRLLLTWKTAFFFFLFFVEAACTVVFFFFLKKN